MQERTTKAFALSDWLEDLRRRILAEPTSAAKLAGQALQSLEEGIRSGAIPSLDALEAEREHWLRLCDSLPHGFLLTDRAGRILEANATAVQMLGLDPSDGRGATILDHIEDMAVARSILRSKLGPGGCEHELRIVPRGKPPFDGLLHVAGLAPLVDGAEKLRWIVQDVSMRHQSFERLRASEERHRNLLDTLFSTAVDGIITIDVDGRITSMNRAAAKMFEYSPEEVVGQNVKLLMPTPFCEEHDDYLLRFRSSGEPRIIGSEREVRGLKKDGSTFPLQLAVSEVDLGEERMFMGVLRDISERRRLEEEFLQAQKMEAIGRLAGGIAHDFNNLLMGILGCCRMALNRLPPSSDAAQHVQDISEAAERGSALTRQLLAFGRKRTSERGVIDLNQVLRSDEPMLRQLLSEDILLIVEPWREPAPVMADAGQVTQVLMNMAVNARDAMPHGGTFSIRIDEVRCAGDDRGKGGERVPRRFFSILVRDTGVGMDAETQAHAFEPFFTTKAVGEGTGLGLSTVYAIIQQHGGHLHLESEPGRGTTFRVHLPPAPQVASIVEPEPVSSPKGGGETILLVEDERLVRASVRILLGELGYNVLEAADPAEALELAGQYTGTIDLLLTDIVMPGMGGPELARKLTAANPRLRVLFMSAFPAETLVEQGRLERGEPSLEKPFSEEALAAKVREVIEVPRNRGGR